MIDLWNWLCVEYWRGKNARCNRGNERPSVNLKKMYYTGFVPINIGPCKQYKHLVFGSITVSAETGNNCVCVGDDIVLVSNIIYWNDEVHFVIRDFMMLVTSMIIH